MTDTRVWCGAQRRVYDRDFGCLLPAGHGGRHYIQVWLPGGELIEDVEW